MPGLATIASTWRYARAAVARMPRPGRGRQVAARSERPCATSRDSSSSESSPARVATAPARQVGDPRRPRGDDPRRWPSSAGTGPASSWWPPSSGRRPAVEVRTGTDATRRRRREADRPSPYRDPAPSSRRATRASAAPHRPAVGEDCDREAPRATVRSGSDTPPLADRGRPAPRRRPGASARARRLHADHCGRQQDEARYAAVGRLDGLDPSSDRKPRVRRIVAGRLRVGPVRPAARTAAVFAPRGRREEIGPGPALSRCRSTTPERPRTEA